MAMKRRTEGALRLARVELKVWPAASLRRTEGWHWLSIEEN